jgi:hypothetical protein
MNLIKLLFPILDSLAEVLWFLEYNSADEISKNNYELSQNPEEYEKVIKKIRLDN